MPAPKSTPGYGPAHLLARLLGLNRGPGRVIFILWPSFVVAVCGTVAMFAFIDPVDLRWVGPFELGRKAGYALGFVLMWAFAACSSAFTWYLMRSPEDVNSAR